MKALKEALGTKEIYPLGIAYHSSSKLSTVQRWVSRFPDGG